MPPKPLSKDAIDNVAGGVTTIVVVGAPTTTEGWNDIIRGPEDDGIRGTEEADWIRAGAGNDGVFSNAGNDIVFGDAGDDLICTEAGDDIAYGGDGRDHLDGGAGQDTLYGGGENDMLDGGGRDGAADMAYGGLGDDVFRWGPGCGNDYFDGSYGKDTLYISQMSMHDLQASLQVEGNTNLQMQVNDKTITFTDASGKPATFAGTINYGGETLRFVNVEQIFVR